VSIKALIELSNVLSLMAAIWWINKFFNSAVDMKNSFQTKIVKLEGFL
jgi:hypothetical protein